MSPELKILIVDDSPVVRVGLRALLAADPSLTVVGKQGTETPPSPPA